MYRGRVPSWTHALRSKEIRLRSFACFHTGAASDVGGGKVELGVGVSEGRAASILSHLRRGVSVRRALILSWGSAQAFMGDSMNRFRTQRWMEPPTFTRLYQHHCGHNTTIKADEVRVPSTRFLLRLSPRT